MASLAELMFQNASQSIRDTKSDPSAIARAYQGGVALAQKQEQLEIQKQQNAQAQQDAQYKGLDKTLDWLSTVQKFKDPKIRNKMMKTLPAVTQAYGAQKIINPIILESIQDSPDVQAAILFQRSKVQRGEKTAKEAVMALMDIGALAEAMGEFHNFIADEKTAITEANKNRRSKDQILAARVKQEAEFEQFPVKEKQKKIISAVTDFQNKGGFARTDRNIKVAENILKKLEKRDLKTGTLKLKGLLNIPFTEQMNMVRTLDSDLALALDEMQSAVNVKNALDSQFSDAMAVRVFSRVLDPLASNEANIQRVKDFIETTKNEKKEKRKLVEQYGSLNNVATESPRTVRESDNLGITEQQIPILKTTYESILKSGNSPKEAFQLLKAFLQSKSNKPINDQQVNNIIRSFQIENRK